MGILCRNRKRFKNETREYQQDSQDGRGTRYIILVRVITLTVSRDEGKAYRTLLHSHIEHLFLRHKE